MIQLIAMLIEVLEKQKELNPYPDGLPEPAQKELANRYAELFSLFLKHRDKISRVTLWAVHDSQSWRSYWPIIGRTDYPMLFDSQCTRKWRRRRAYRGKISWYDSQLFCEGECIWNNQFHWGAYWMQPWNGD